MQKRYAQLIRARKWTLDALRRELVELESLRDQIHLKLDALEKEIDAEQVFATRNNLASDYASYARAAIDRRDSLTASLIELEKRVAEKHAEVTEAFQDVKSIEIAAERAYKRERDERRRRDTARLDEIATLRYARDAG